ncbi:MAG: MFS transporter [Chloroflexi bacterium]|nr:MFS transporter [Chloroflexota bacterium]MYE31990.1 MFS transporter [Chloroflexota bacterium]
MTNAPAARPRQGLFYGWYIAYGGAVSNFVTIGIAAFSLTVFIGPLREEMGWTAAAITFGFSLGTLEQGLLAPFTGFLIDRLGPRKMAATGVVILSLGLLLFSQARSLEVYYLASLLMATGNSIGSLMAFSAAVMNWFERKRARAMGVLNAGNGAGYFVVPIVALLVSWLGWRETLMIASAIVLTVGLPLALLLRDRPQPYGYLPDGEPPEDRTGAPIATPALTGFTVGAGLRIPAFYLLALANACGTFAIVAWVVLQVPHLEQNGFSTGFAALIVAFYGAFQVAMRIVAGWIADTLGRRRVYALGFLLLGIGMLMFVQLEPGRLWLIPFYYAAFGLGHAAWLVVQMTLIGDYFGTLRFATLRGLASMFQTPVTMIAPVLAGFIFDQTGTYDVIFTIYAGIAACGAIFVMIVRRPMWNELQAARAAGPPPRPAPAMPAPAGAMPVRPPAPAVAPSMDGAPMPAGQAAQSRLTHAGMADSGP